MIAFRCPGLLTAMFGITGTGFNVAKRLTNDGKVGLHDWLGLDRPTGELTSRLLSGSSLLDTTWTTGIR